MGCPRSERQRSSLRPATCGASPVPAPWSNTPDLPPENEHLEPSLAGPDSPVPAVRVYGPRRGARSGARCRTTRSTPAGTATSRHARPTSSNRPRHKPWSRSDPQTAPRRRHHRPGMEPDHRCGRHHQHRGGSSGLKQAVAREDARHKQGRGEAFRGIENHQASRRSSQAAPARRHHTPVTRCRATKLRYRYAGTDDETRDPTQTLDTKRLTLMSGRCGTGLLRAELPRAYLPFTSPHRAQCKQKTALTGSPPQRCATPTTRKWRRFPHLQTGGLVSGRR